MPFVLKPPPPPPSWGERLWQGAKEYGGKFLDFAMKPLADPALEALGVTSETGEGAPTADEFWTRTGKHALGVMPFVGPAFRTLPPKYQDVAGSVVGGFARGTTSPAGLATLIPSGGTSSLWQNAAMQGLRRAGGATFATQGLKDIYEGETLPEKAIGALELAGGAVGVRPATRIPPPVRLPAGLPPASAADKALAARRVGEALTGTVHGPKRPPAGVPVPAAAPATAAAEAEGPVLGPLLRQKLDALKAGKAGGKAVKEVPPVDPALEDALYQEAVAKVRKMKSPSIMGVSGSMKVPRTKAHEWLTRMEQEGIVSPIGEGGARTVVPIAPPPLAPSPSAAAPLDEALVARVREHVALDPTGAFTPSGVAKALGIQSSAADRALRALPELEGYVGGYRPKGLTERTATAPTAPAAAQPTPPPAAPRAPMSDVELERFMDMNAKQSWPDRFVQKYGKNKATAIPPSPEEKLTAWIESIKTSGDAPEKVADDLVRAFQYSESERFRQLQDAYEAINGAPAARVDPITGPAPVLEQKLAAVRPPPDPTRQGLAQLLRQLRAGTPEAGAPRLVPKPPAEPMLPGVEPVLEAIRKDAPRMDAPFALSAENIARPKPKAADLFAAEFAPLEPPAPPAAPPPSGTPGPPRPPRQSVTLVDTEKALFDRLGIDPDSELSPLQQIAERMRNERNERLAARPAAAPKTPEAPAPAAAEPDWTTTTPYGPDETIAQARERLPPDLQEWIKENAQRVRKAEETLRQRHGPPESPKTPASTAASPPLAPSPQPPATEPLGGALPPDWIARAQEAEAGLAGPHTVRGPIAHAAPMNVLQRLNALREAKGKPPIAEAGVGVEAAPRTGTRATGTNPRATGENPRALNQRAARMAALDQQMQTGTPEERRAALREWITLTKESAERRGRISEKTGFGTPDQPLTPEGPGEMPAQARALWDKYGETGGISPELYQLLGHGARAAVGGAAGAAYDKEDRLRGALTGAVAAGLPYKRIGKFATRTLAGAVKRTPKVMGDLPPVFDTTITKDIKPWQMLEAANYAVPDVAEEIRPFLGELESLYHGGLKGKALEDAQRVYTKEVAKHVSGRAKEATEAGFTRRARYLSKLADRIANKATPGEQFLMDMTGRKLGGVRKIEQGAKAAAYHVGTAANVGSGIVNLSQPALALKFVGPKSLAKGYRKFLTPEGQAATKGLVLERPLGFDPLEDVAATIGTKASSGYQIAQDFLQKPLTLTDNLNRRVVYLAALEEAGKRGVTGDAAKKWAMDVVYATQGERGVLGASPVMRGPVAGSLAPFTKFPILYSSLMARAAAKPNAGTARLAALLGGSAAVTKGLETAYGPENTPDLGDLFTSGGRPFGFDPLHPIRSGRRVLTEAPPVPAVRFAKDLAKHIPGGPPADHTLLEDVGELAIPGYLRKLGAEAKDIARFGRGEHERLDARGLPRDRHTLTEAGINLMGLRSSRQTQEQELYSKINETMQQASGERRNSLNDLKSQLAEALAAKDYRTALEVARQLPKPTRKDFTRRSKLSRFERVIANQPKDVRRKLEEQFGAEARRLESAGKPSGR